MNQQRGSDHPGVPALKDSVDMPRDYDDHECRRDWQCHGRIYLSPPDQGEEIHISVGCEDASPEYRRWAGYNQKLEPVMSRQTYQELMNRLRETIDKHTSCSVACLRNCDPHGLASVVAACTFCVCSCPLCYTLHQRELMKAEVDQIMTELASTQKIQGRLRKAVFDLHDLKHRGDKSTAYDCDGQPLLSFKNAPYWPPEGLVLVVVLNPDIADQVRKSWPNRLNQQVPGAEMVAPGGAPCSTR